MALTVILFTLTIGAIVAIFALLRRNGQKSTQEGSRRNVKHVSMRNPLIAMLKKERMELSTAEKIKREGKVWGFSLMNSYTILVAEPELVQLVLSKEFTNFTNRRTFRISDPILGNMLSNAEGAQWKRLRSIISPTFSASSLRRMKPRIDYTVEKLVDNFKSTMQNSDEIDMKRLYGAYAMETIIHAAFGVKVDSLAEPNNPIIVYAKKSFSNDMTVKSVLGIMFIILFPGVAEKFGIRYKGDVTDFFRAFAEEIINRKKEELKGSGAIGKASTFLELLLEAEAENDRQQGAEKESLKYMSTDEMVAQALLFILAGYETSSTTMTMASYLLALNPSAQEKLYDEIVTVTDKLAKENPEKSANPVELITIEALSQFEYLNAVINETLRLYPPATATERQASEDIVLEWNDIRINVKKDDVIYIPIYSMHRDETQFPEPEAFKPERFLGEQHFHNYSFLPFGLGPRGCVAKSLALMEAKLALLHTIRLFKFSRCDKTKVPVELYYQANFITPKDIILKVEKR